MVLHNLYNWLREPVCKKSTPCDREDKMIPVIEAVTPITEPASVIPEKMYNKLWISAFVISSPDPNQSSEAQVVFNYYAEKDGVKELRQNSSFAIKIENLFARAKKDSELELLLNNLTNYIIKVGKEQGVIK